MSPRRSNSAVQVYYSRFCMYCAMAERLLQFKGVAYDKIHVGGFADLTVLEARGELDALLAGVVSG